MKRVVNHENEATIMIDKLSEYQLIIAKKDAKVAGMIVRNNETGKFIHRINCRSGCSGYFDSIKKCIQASEHYGFKFYVV